MTFNDGQIRRGIDRSDIIGRVVGGVRFAAAGNCGRIRYRARRIVGDVHCQGDR